MTPVLYLDIERMTHLYICLYIDAWLVTHVFAIHAACVTDYKPTCSVSNLLPA